MDPNRLITYYFKNAYNALSLSLVIITLNPIIFFIRRAKNLPNIIQVNCKMHFFGRAKKDIGNKKMIRCNYVIVFVQVKEKQLS